jgi:hypothetical protein
LTYFLFALRTRQVSQERQFEPESKEFSDNGNVNVNMHNANFKARGLVPVQSPFMFYSLISVFGIIAAETGINEYRREFGKRKFRYPDCDIARNVSSQQFDA